MSLKPFILILCLKSEAGFNKYNTHLLSVLRQKDVVRKATSLSQARRYLTSTTRPHAVILADADVAEPEYHELLMRLVDYATAGGTVIYSGQFNSFGLYADLDTMFQSAWGLPWRVSASCTTGSNVVNTRVKGLDTKSLVKHCSFTATRLHNVALEDAIYVTLPAAKELEKGQSSTFPGTGAYETPAALAKVGRGRVGYVGDMYNRKATTTNLILAMCFWPGSRAPIPPGDGVPEVLHKEPTSVKDAVTSSHSTSGAASDLGTRRNILIISLEKEDYTDDIYAQFYEALRENATVTEVQQPRAALAKLSATPRPDAIILSDPALTNSKHKKLLTTLIDYTRAGGIVVLALQFSNYLKPNQSRPFFARWGVPWERGSYFRTTTALNPSGIPAPLNKDALVPSVSAKALHVKNAPREHAVYLPTATSHVESYVFAPDPITSEAAQESPAVFAHVGEGYLGYVGDVNGEQGSTRLIFEMCGVKIHPGDLGTRTVSTGTSIFSDGRREAITEVETEVPLPAPAPPPPPPREPRPRDAEVAVRAEARRKMREEKSMRADALKVEGNNLFKQEKWEEAAEKYREAALAGGPQPVYLSNLAACLLKLELWDAADSAATRALMYDANHIKALYRRALARKELDQLNAALADLEWLLTIDKFNMPALQERITVRDMLDEAGSIDWPEDHLARSKRDQDTAMDIEDESDSEDFAHPGTGIACRYYNTSDTGCRYGKTCRFRHAPDSKSVRDELGRNVCVYWLLGHCRFAAGGCCVYAHDATYLPERGWWTDTARLERMRADFDACVQEEPLDLGAGRVEERILAEALVPLPWRKDLWAVAPYDENAYGLGSDGYDEDEDEDDYAHKYGFDEEADYYDEDEFNEFGMTDADVQEMLSYGIKPWEDDAFEEMLSIQHALSRLY